MEPRFDDSRPAARRVVIVGGGISGLSVAWFLHRKGFDVRVLEAGDRPGGVIDTDRADGFLAERGPNSTLQKPGGDEDALGRLVDQVGLGARLNEAGEAAKKRFVMRGGRLRPLPGSPPAFLTTRLFSLRAKIGLLREPFVGRADEEESIAAFVERRLGREFLDYAVEPFVTGVYAGDPRALSVRAAVPRIYALERDYGSLIRGAVALGKAGKAAGAPSGRLISFDAGMATLPAGIAAGLPAGVVCIGTRATALDPVDGGWEIAWSGPAGDGRLTAARVVLAVPAAAAADLVTPLSAEAARLLRAIAYAPILTLALGYERDQVGHPLDGFGFLVPRREGVRILGGLFSSTLFPDRAPAGQVLITAFIGGTADNEAVALADEDAVALVRADVERILAIRGAPCWRRLTRHPQAIPQYGLGHLDRVARIDELLAGFAGLHLRAAWRDGVSVADCIRNGERLADRLG